MNTEIIKTHKTMGKKEIIKDLSHRTGNKRETCEGILDALTDTITDFLIDDKKILIKGLISLESVDRGEYAARNPVTGKTEMRPSSKVIRCRIAQSIKDAVNRKEIR